MNVLASRLFVVVLAACALSACAVGNTYDYRTAPPNLTSATARSLTVGVLDRRPYVLSNNKSPSFVGLQRAALGNPWNVNTVSRAPLADEFGSIIADGFNIKPTPLPLRTPVSEALDRLKARKTDRMLLVTIFEWKTDTYVNVALHYRVDAKVYDPSGRVLGENAIQGRDNLGPVTLPSQVGPLAAAAAKRKFEQLLNAPAIQQSLQ